MKKNKMMRIASAVAMATLLSTCVISGTFAKYTTSATSTDTARVATWGFTTTTMDISGLFAKSYTNDDGMTAKADAIAPGTTNSATFTFAYDGQEAAPEVAYTFTVDTTGSVIADDIKANTSIQWKLDDGDWGTWDTMIADIKALSGDASGTKTYKPGELPTGFSASDDVHTIAWQWVFEGNDVADTALGNKATLDSVTITIAITATQVDTYTATP